MLRNRINYKPGNRVVVRTDLIIDQSYGGLHWIPGMNLTLSGKTVEIKECSVFLYVSSENGSAPSYGISKEMVDKPATLELQLKERKCQKLG